MMQLINNSNQWSELAEKVINKYPDNFCILQTYGGFFGSLVYRIICGSSDNFVWNSNFCGTAAESLAPLEWPKLTEGFDIYRLSNNRDYIWFKENHLATAHISHPMIEKSTIRQIVSAFDPSEILLLRTHELHYHTLFKCKIVRIVGNILNICNFSKTEFRKHGSTEIYPVEQGNLHNLYIENLMSENYDTFLEEYLSLCKFLDSPVNINNVRQFILLLRDKLRRYELSLS